MVVKGLTAKQFFSYIFLSHRSLLKRLGLNSTLMYSTMYLLLDINNCKDRPKSGYLWSVCTKGRIERICEKIRRNPQRFANKIAAEENESRRTVQVILNEDLRFRPNRKRKVQCLTKSQRIKVIQRYEKLI